MKTYSKIVELGSNHVLFNICEEATQKPLAIALLDLRNGQIGCLLVDSEFREQGIGTKLIEAIEEYA